MGWQTDWLYQLVFDEVERVWQRAIKDGVARFGPAPKCLVISEMLEADWEESRCRGVANRQWTYQGGHPKLLSPCEGNATEFGEQRGMFYELGVVTFCIDADRKRLVFSYTLGPRYGRAMTFTVIGQGKNGRLAPADGRLWVS
jgi:hypothetical protein